MLLPRDLLEDAIRGLARTFSYRRFPVLAEIRAVVVEELARRRRLVAAVDNLARDHARRLAPDRGSPVRRVGGEERRAGGLQPIRCAVIRHR